MNLNDVSQMLSLLNRMSVIQFGLLGLKFITGQFLQRSPEKASVLPGVNASQLGNVYLDHRYELSVAY
jgi:hypothetical protein